MGIRPECYELFCTNTGSNIQWNNNSTATYLPSWKTSKLDMQDKAAEARTDSLVTFFHWPLDMDVPPLTDK